MLLSDSYKYLKKDILYMLCLRRISLLVVNLNNIWITQ